MMFKIFRSSKVHTVNGENKEYKYGCSNVAKLFEKKITLLRKNSFCRKKSFWKKNSFCQESSFWKKNSFC